MNDTASTISCKSEQEIKSYLRRPAQFVFYDTQIDRQEKDYTKIIDQSVNDRTYLYATSHTEVSANVFLRKGVLSTKHQDISTYWVSQQPEYHFEDSESMILRVYLRADKEFEISLINERDFADLLSSIGGLTTALIGPIGFILQTLVSRHFKAHLIKSLYYLNQATHKKAQHSGD